MPLWHHTLIRLPRWPNWKLSVWGLCGKVWAGMASITVCKMLQTASIPFLHIPNGWRMPSTVVVVRILDISQNIICSAIAILAQTEVC